MIEQMKQWLEALELSEPEMNHQYGLDSPECEAHAEAIGSLQAAIDKLDQPK